MTMEQPAGEGEMNDATILMHAALVYMCQGKTTASMEFPLEVLRNAIRTDDLVMGVENREGIDFLVLASQPKGKQT